MRVLVTGTEDCLGCPIAPTLFEDGHDIVGQTLIVEGAPK